jgi:cytochrome c
LDSFEFNKIAGGVIASVLAVLLINTFGHSVFHTEPLEANAYVVEGVVREEAAADGEGGAEEQGPSFAALLAEADPADGEKAFKKCAACHSADPAAGHRTGPNLYNTVGHPIGGHAGFNYSDALKNHGGTWTLEQLDGYLENPKAYIPGNKMSFAGLKRAAERAAVIAYLNTKTDTPLPLPKVEEAAAPEAAAEAAADAAEAPAAEAAE